MSVASPILPIMKRLTGGLITLKDASKNVVALSIGFEGEGARGYFDGLKPSISSSESQDERIQGELWALCEKWAKIERLETVLQ